MDLARYDSRYEWKPCEILTVVNVFTRYYAFSSPVWGRGGVRGASERQLDTTIPQSQVFKFLHEFLALAPRTTGVREVAGHGETEPSDKPIRVSQSLFELVARG